MEPVPLTPERRHSGHGCRPALDLDAWGRSRLVRIPGAARFRTGIPINTRRPAGNGVRGALLRMRKTRHESAMKNETLPDRSFPCSAFCADRGPLAPRHGRPGASGHWRGRRDPQEAEPDKAARTINWQAAIVAGPSREESGIRFAGSGRIARWSAGSSTPRGRGIGDQRGVWNNGGEGSWRRK